MTTLSNFSGLWIPLVTPFHHDRVDHTALSRLVKHLRAAGVSGFVACGSTGEAAALDPVEQLAVLDTVLLASGDLPVVMGLAGCHLGNTVSWVQQLASRPLAGLLVPAPYYILPSQAGLKHWFTALADASSQPLIVYDIPYRTGVRLTLETLLTLSDHPNIRAIKDCGGDPRKTQALITDGRLQVLAGEDAQILSTLALGGAGAIATSAHLRTTEFVQLLQLMRENELPQARAQWQVLAALVDTLFSEPNPVLIKAGLAHQGLIHKELRLPMTAATVAGEERLQRLLSA